VERTLLSAAFDFDLGFGFDLDLNLDPYLALANTKATLPPQRGLY